MNILFITEVGSTMWGMADLASDRDRIVIYQNPTRAILRGESCPATQPQEKYLAVGDDGQGIEIDEQYMEIGHLIGLLIKGNVNAIWAVMSPITIKDHPALQELRRIVPEEMSLATYPSIRGMAISQARDNEKRPAMSSNKGYRTALRTIRFGITMLIEKRFAFESVPDNCASFDYERIVRQAIRDLELAAEGSTLPERPQEEPFRQLLYEIRMAELVHCQSQ